MGENGQKKVSISTLKKCIGDPRAFIKVWAEKKGKSARDLAVADIKSTMLLDYKEYCSVLVAKGNKIRPLSHALLEHALVEYIYQNLEKERNELSQVIYSKEPITDLSELEKFVKVLSVGNDDLNVMVLAHWLWSVKRKAKGLRVIHHIMPIIVGMQGGGKTFAIRNLLRPILGLVIHPRLEDMSDPRQYEAYSENLVAFCDELQGIDKVDMNSLKLQITAENNTFRRLFTTQSVKVPMRVSFIGASNRPINESIIDPTGMRRFYQINAPTKLDWDVVESIDYLKIWHGIDETREDGYLVRDFLDNARQYQESFTHLNEFQIYIKDFALLPIDDKFKSIKMVDLYKHFQQWSMSEGYRNVNRQWLTIKLNNLGLHTYVKNNKTYCKVNPAFELGANEPVETTVLSFKKEEA